MTKKISIIICFVLQSIMVMGQSGFTTIGGANFVGYGRAGVNIGGIESIYLNQAGLTGVKNFAFDISAERRFNLDELSNISFAGAKTFKFGTVGMVLSNFGNSDYSEQKFGLAYAKKLSSAISLGGQFDLLRLNISQFGSKNIYTFEVGMQLRLTKDFSVATHVFSPGNITINESTDLGTRFRLGLKYQPSTKVFVLVEIDKLIYREIEYKLGISYQAIKALQLRLGVNPSNETFSFGVALHFQDTYRIATAYSLQNNLGNTPAISLQYHK